MAQICPKFPHGPTGHLLNPSKIQASMSHMPSRPCEDYNCHVNYSHMQTCAEHTFFDFLVTNIF